MVAYTVVNQAHVSSALIARAERATAIEVNHQVRPRWHNPKITFTRYGGQKVNLVPLSTSEHICGGFPACHNRYFIYVGHVTNHDDLTLLFSHEIMERISRHEICDQDDGDGHWQNGVYVAAFRSPRGIEINWTWKG